MSVSDPKTPPLIKELSERLKEPFNLITRLGDMAVFSKNSSNPNSYKPSLPTIVVLGEDSAAITLIRRMLGLRIPPVLRFPLILKYTTTTESHLPSNNILLQFFGKEIEACESDLEIQISKLTEGIPDNEKCVEVTMTLVDPRAHDVQVVILPGIYKHPQEEEQMSLYEGYITRCTQFNESMFLNLLPCISDFDECLSSKLVAKLDQYGTRTVTVFSVLQQCDDSLIERLTTTTIESGYPFGYSFLVDDEDTLKDDTGGKQQQSQLLSEIDKSLTGLEAIAKNIVTGLLAIMFSPESQLVKRVKKDLSMSERQLERRQQTFNTVAEATPVIVETITTANTTLRQLFVTQEYLDYVNEPQMHAAADIAFLFRRFRSEMLALKLGSTSRFLLDELSLLSMINWPFQTNFVSASVTGVLLNSQFSYATITIDRFVRNVKELLLKVVIRVFTDNAGEHEQLHQLLKEIGRILVAGVMKSFQNKLDEMIALEKGFVYASNEEYKSEISEMKKVKLDLHDKKFVTIEGLGINIQVEHLRTIPSYQIEAAFEIKKLMIVYWEYVVKRFVDYLALNLQSAIKDMMSVDVWALTREYLMERIKDISKLPAADPTLETNRTNLQNRIARLKNIMKEIEDLQLDFEFLL